MFLQEKSPTAIEWACRNATVSATEPSRRILWRGEIVEADILEKMAPVEQQLQLGRHRALTTRRSVQLRGETGLMTRHYGPRRPGGRHQREGRR